MTEAPNPLPQDLIDLVIAARLAVEDPNCNTLDDLEKAAEAFAAQVPWDDEPEEA